MPTKTRQKPNLLWYQHVLGGAKHGFDAAGIAQAQENYAIVKRAEAQGVPAPLLPRHPMDDIAAQIRTGKLVPCAEPTIDEINTVSLSEEQIAELEKADLKESKAAKRARLLAELEELGDEDDDEDPEDVPGPAEGVAGAPAGPGTTKPSGRGRSGAKAGGEE